MAAVNTAEADELLRRLLVPLFEQGTRPVHASLCCGKLYVGETAPAGCRKCGKVPPAIGFDALEEARFDLIPIGTPPP